jgi:hypothetical protein
MLTDAAFLESLLTEAGALNHKIDVVGSRTTATVEVAAPEAARRFTGATLTATLTIDWGTARPDGSHRGPITVVFEKLPAKLSGTATLSPTATGTDTGTTVAYDADFTISIPFVGRKLEATAAPYVMRIIDAQQPRGTAWLAEHSA